MRFFKNRNTAVTPAVQMTIGDLANGNIKHGEGVIKGNPMPQSGSVMPGGQTYLDLNQHCMIVTDKMHYIVPYPTR